MPKPKYKFRLTLSVTLKGESQQDLVSESNHKAIIEAAFAGWLIWAQNKQDKAGWKLCLFEQNKMIKMESHNDHLILNPSSTLN